MDVLEDEHRRPVAGDALDEIARSEEQAFAVDRPVGLEAEQQCERLCQLGAFGGAPELLQRDRGLVVVEDPGHLLHLLGERAYAELSPYGSDRPRNAPSPAD